jgi:hypothetical protein
MDGLNCSSAFVTNKEGRQHTTIHNEVSIRRIACNRASFECVAMYANNLDHLHRILVVKLIKKATYFVNEAFFTASGLILRIYFSLR